MQAGRELDALVAARIFGLVACDRWKDLNFGSSGGPALMKNCAHAEGACYPSMERGSLNGKFGGPARYSTDISAAWLVVLALLARGIPSRTTASPNGFSCRFTTPSTGCYGGEHHVASADTTPLAICLAALETLGVEAPA